MSLAAQKEGLGWQPTKPKLRPTRLAVSWLVATAAVYVAAAIVPGISLVGVGGAFLVAAVIAAFNAILPPLVAALRLPFALLSGFLAILVVDASRCASPTRCCRR